MHLFIYVLSVAVLATTADLSGCLRHFTGSEDFSVSCLALYRSFVNPYSGKFSLYLINVCPFLLSGSGPDWSYRWNHKGFVGGNLQFHLCFVWSTLNSTLPRALPLREV